MAETSEKERRALQMAKTLKERTGEAEAKAGALETQLANVLSLIATRDEALSRMHEQVATAHQALLVARAEVNEVHDERTRALQQRDSVSGELAALQLRMAEQQRETVSVNEQLQATLADLEQTRLCLQQERDRATACDAQTERLQQQCNSLNAELEELKRTIRHLESLRTVRARAFCSRCCSVFRFSGLLFCCQ